jgi:hypothetical protein
MFALRNDERKLQYSRSNILGYFTNNNVPDGIKNATHKLATEIKISKFFRKWLNTSMRLFNMYSYLMHEQKLPLYHSMFVIRFLRHALTSQI